MENKTTADIRAQMVDCGIPLAVIIWLTGDPDKRDEHGDKIDDPGMLFPKFVAKAKRFHTEWEKNKNNKIANEIISDWKAIEENAKNTTSLIGFFIALPDSAEAQPSQHLFGHRNKTVSMEKKQYGDLNDHCKAILNFINSPDLLWYLATDSAATSEKMNRQFYQFNELLPQMQHSLCHLQAVLDGVDAGAKIPAKKKSAKDLPARNYTHQLAQLNRFLRDPQPAPISRLAAINNPSIVVEAATIARSWGRNTDKPT